jgi:hypothetical protein
VSNLNNDDMVNDCGEVLRTLVFRQTEVQTKQERRFFLRIMPYRTAENIIDGLFLIFVESTPRSRRKSLRRLSKVFADALETTGPHRRSK